MKIYNDYMHDFLVIILYEFLGFYKPLIINLIFYYLQILSTWLNIYLYIPKTNKIDLKQVIIVSNSKIIYCNLLNMNYYHLKININNNSIDIRGNKKYILYNNTFLQFRNSPYFSIYELPIKRYDQEDCCICYNNIGVLHGLCGHQIICSSCVKYINKCPLCNFNFLENSHLLEKILYI
jgi:hypothetical protein